MQSPNRHVRRPLFVLATFLTPLLMLAIAGQSMGATLTAHWIGTADGKWSAPSNWDIGQVPNNANGDVFDVVWDAHPVSITLDRNIVIRSNSFAQPGELTGVASLTIEGDLIGARDRWREMVPPFQDGECRVALGCCVGRGRT
jgi:hypothetical protein